MTLQESDGYDVRAAAAVERHRARARTWRVRWIDGDGSRQSVEVRGATARTAAAMVRSLRPVRRIESVEVAQ